MAKIASANIRKLDFYHIYPEKEYCNQQVENSEGIKCTNIVEGKV
jgi:hypothetical protein